MNSRGFLTLIAALALVGLSVVSPVAALQETATANGTETDAQPTYKGSVDSQVHVLDYEYTDGQMVVTLQADRPKHVVVSDLKGESGGEGVSNIPQKEQVVSSGVTTIRLGARQDAGEVAISISTADNAVRIEKRTSAIVFTTAASWGDVQAVAMIVPFGGLWAAFIVGNRIRDNKTPSTERKN